MTALAIILHITQAGGSYARAGLVSGVGALGVGVFAPAWSRIADRRGQTVVLLTTAAAVAASALVLAVLPPRGALAPLLVASTLMGAAQPPALLCARSLWPRVVADAHVLESTYSVESAMHELVFIVDPLLAVAVAAIVNPAGAIAASGLLASAGGVALAMSRPSRNTRAVSRQVAPASQRRRSALRVPTVQLLAVTAFVMVLAFAAVDVSTVAAGLAHGGNATAGVMIALWSIGSMVGGLVFGSRSWPGTLSVRIVGLLAAIAVLTGVLALLSNVIALTAVLFVSGLFYAPSFSCINQVAQRTSTPGTAIESFAWINSGALGGAAAGSALGGLAISDGGFAAGYALAAAALVGAVSIVTGGLRLLRRGDTESTLPVEVAPVRP